MSITESVARGRRRAATGLFAVAGMALGSACVPGGSADSNASSSNLTALSYSQFVCIGRADLDGLSNVRPPTIDEIVRVLNAASACGFTPPRGYAAQYHEHITGQAAPRTTTAPSTVPYLESTQVKCVADQQLGGLVGGGAPTWEDLRRVMAAAAICGLRLS